MSQVVILMVGPDSTLAPLPGDWSAALSYLAGARAVGLADGDIIDDLCSRYEWSDVDLEDLPAGVAFIVEPI